MFNPVGVRRAQLWHELTTIRGYKCEKCGGSNLIFDLHEGIVSRGDVAGWPKEKRILIFHEYNCFIVCRDCHIFDRQWFWDKSCERHGEKEVRKWYEGLPWKLGKPPRYFYAS